MGKTFTMKLEGLDKVLNRIEKIGGASFANMVDQELETAANTVASEARTAAPRGRSGRLKFAIQAETAVRFTKGVRVNASYAPYVEFGTGKNVFQGAYNFTPAQRKYASQFYVSGKGKTKSHAFLFPAFEREKPRLLGRIKNRMFT
jgi:hypothetical protein